ncbi:MAG: filamentous hemagglutinin N-terminal domain-containing protein [Nitrospira sp.]|nr:filamentous hemagglutinin N-terminal domain-containing protein [Nitrospira sp.]
MGAGFGTRLLAATVIACQIVPWLCAPLSFANPTGPAVVGGNATVSGLGTSRVTINQASQRAILNWQSFNIAPHEVTQFVQPNASAIALNRIFDHNPSQILGSLRANGTVMLVNPNGVFFGPNAQVNVGGLIASSLNITNANFLAGHYLFEGAGVEGIVNNLGLIRGIHDGVYLLAPNVENGGVITAPGGNIVLAAGTKAYLATRPDGRGFLAELSAPTGGAVNVNHLVADGGHVTLAGRVVNQGGVVQANSVREKNGKIELYASESLTVKAGSQTLAKGDNQSTSNGGTILAIADKTKGTAVFEKGATIDVSGGAKGGHAGFTELSGSSVKLGGHFVGSAAAGFRGGRLLIDPIWDIDLGTLTVTDFADIILSSPRDAGGNLLAGYDLRVTGFFDLNTVQPPATGGTIRFDAGQDLIFNDVLLSNDPFGLQANTPAKWDIVGVAERDILFTGFTGTMLHTAYGGSINLQAKAGNVNLSDPQSGILSTIRAGGGGGISIKTGKDLIASSGFDESGGPLQLFHVQGINIDGPGRLNLEVGGNFIGGLVSGVGRGPGFVLWNGDLASRPQHTVTVGGRIGDTNLPLGADGLPLTVAEQRAKDPIALPVAERTDRYADFALSGGELTVSAGGNIYLRRVQDAGLVGGGLNADGVTRQPAFAPGLENNKVAIVSRDGHILINTNRTDGPQEPIQDLAALRGWLPASFEARAEQGTIQIRSDLTFLPSPTGSVTFYAKNDIQGVPKTRRTDDTNNFAWLWVGVQGIPGGRWEVVDLRTISQRPDLFPYLRNLLNPPRDSELTPHPDVPPGDFTFPAFNPPKWPLNTRIDVEMSPPMVRLLEVDPSRLVGNTTYSEMVPWSRASVSDSNVPLAPDSTAAPAPVIFKAEQGDISKLALNLLSRPYRKDVTIEAGNRIDRVLASIALHDLGTRTETVTERVPLFVDPTTNQPRPIEPDDVVLIRAVNPLTQQVEVRPWDGTESVAVSDLVNVVFREVQVPVVTPVPTATIKAKDMLLSQGPEGSEGGFNFFGPGAARIIATGNLDLGTGKGISAAPRPDRTSARGGLIDIAVGNDVDMVISSMVSSGGAGISIHGYDAAKPYVVGYDNSALYPVQFPDSAREGLNLPAVGGKVNVGENSVLSGGSKDRATGIQVTNGGSVGQMAQEPVVNQDGTVTVNVVKDPAAVLIRATGDVDVNKSRIATFNGGDIRITSTRGNINAGSGGRNERIFFDVPTGEFDSNGNEMTRAVEVPGSGIFTFHPDDPKPLKFPAFNDAEINALLAQAGRERTFGRDVSALEAKANRLRAERLKIFEEQVLNPYIEKLKLADIALTAETGVRAVARNTIPADGSGRIIIPEAGIQGRNVSLNGVLDFRGGSITGRVFLPPNAAVVGQPSFVGGAPPPGVAPPPPPLTGGGSAAAASSTAASTSSSMKNADSTQEAATESSQRQTGSDRVASDTESKKNDKLAKAMRVKRGVVIQVDVKPQAQSAN